MSYALSYMPNNQIFPWSKLYNVLPIFAYFAHIFHSPCKINAPCGCVILVLWHRFNVAKTREQLIWKWWFVFSSNTCLHVFELFIYLFWSISVSNFSQSIHFCRPCYLAGHILFSVAWLTFCVCVLLPGFWTAFMPHWSWHGICWLIYMETCRSKDHKRMESIYLWNPV